MIQMRYCDNVTLDEWNDVSKCLDLKWRCEKAVDMKITNLFEEKDDMVLR